MKTTEELRQLAITADDLFSKALEAEFGIARMGDARYRNDLPKNLMLLARAKVRADEAWHDSIPGRF